MRKLVIPAKTDKEYRTKVILPEHMLKDICETNNKNESENEMYLFRKIQRLFVSPNEKYILTKLAKSGYLNLKVIELYPTLDSELRFLFIVLINKKIRVHNIIKRLEIMIEVDESTKCSEIQNSIKPYYELDTEVVAKIQERKTKLIKLFLHKI